MSFWLREVAGWVLVLLGLFIFLMCFQFLTASAIFEAWPLAIVGLIVFRGGIHLLKVAVAARVCREAAAGAKIERLAASIRRPDALTRAPEMRS